MDYSFNGPFPFPGPHVDNSCQMDMDLLMEVNKVQVFLISKYHHSSQVYQQFFQGITVKLFFLELDSMGDLQASNLA